MKKWLKNIWLFLRDIVVYFIEIDGTVKATALAFTTLLSIVPFMVVSLGFLVAFPQVSVYFQSLHDALFRHFVPASANTIQKHVEEFASNAAHLSITGLLFFIVTAVMLIFSMESVFNAVWRVKHRRHGMLAFLMYWAVLTLLPPVGGVAFALSLFIGSIPYLSDLIKAIAFIIPIAFDWGAYTFIYMTLPNCKVLFRHAAIGALVAALLFELIKAGFKLYFTEFSNDTLIYGVLAAVPSFLLWLYTAWLITIFGAVIAYKLGVYKKSTE